MKILVTGGTGFLGKYVVKKLSRHNVTIFARNAPKGKKFVTGDIMKADDIEKAFPVDVVVHLVASFDENNPDIFPINVEGTRNIVKLCRKYNVKHLIHMSSTAALGEVKIAAEETAPKPSTRYGRSKKEAEDIVRNSGINYTIIRAPVIIGPSPMWRGVMKAAKNKFPILGNGKNHFHIAYVEDVAELILKCINNKKAFGQVFHIATNDTPTYEEFYAMLCDTLNTEMTERYIPLFVAKIISAVHGITSRIKGKKPNPVLSKSNINRLTRERVVICKNAKRHIGFVPKYNTKEAIAATVNHFKKAGLI